MKKVLFLLLISFNSFGQVYNAEKSNDVVESIGINTHFYYTNTVYWSDYTILRDRLIELGIKHIRDGNAGQNTTYRQRLNELAGYGIKSLLICDTRFGLADNWQQSLTRLKLIMNQSNNPVELIEGPNEMDFSSDFNQLPAQTMALWNTFKNDPETSWIPILGPSLGNTASSPQALGNLSNFMDYGNIHSYSGGKPVESSLGGGWGISLEEAINRYMNFVSGGKLVYATETGYQMIEDGHGNLQVTERAAAKYTPRAILYYLKKGVKRFYHYQLVNDHNNENFGVLNDDFTRREHFYAIKNVINLFSDTSDNFTPGTLEYTLVGDTSNIEHSLFQKSDGTYLLAIWQAAYSCVEGNDANNPPTDIEPPSENLDITFNANADYSIETYLPSFYSNIQQSFLNVNSININIPDHVVVLKITDNNALSVSEINNTDSVKIYPNPTDNKINLELKGNITLTSIKIFDDLGRVVKEFNNTLLDVSSLSDGIYVLELETNEGKITKKFLKK